MTDDREKPAPASDRWAIVEMMGHLTRAGRITRTEEFGAPMMRIEIPTAYGFVTEDVGVASLYRIRWVAEEVARAAAARMADPRPLSLATYRDRPALDHRSNEHPQQENEVDDDGPF